MASKRFRDAVGIDPDRVVSAAVDAALGDGPSRNKKKKKKHHPGRVLAAGAAVAAAAAVGQRRMPRLAKMPLRMGLHKLGDMAHLDDLADAVRDRLSTHDEPPEDDEYYDDEEFEDDDLGDEDEFDDEPRDEDDGDFDDEDDEGFDDEPEDDGGPRGEGDEDEPVDDEEEPVDDEEEPPDDEEFDDEEPEAVEDDQEPEPDEEDEEPEPDEEDEEPEDEEDEEPEEDEEIAAHSLDLGLPAEPSDRRTRGRVPDLFDALRTPHRRAPVMRRGSLRVDPATRPPQPDESPRDERKGRAKKPKSKAARA